MAISTRSLLAATATLGVLAVGCGTDNTAEPVTSPGTNRSSVSAFGAGAGSGEDGSTIEWSPCQDVDGYDCATLQVPLDRGVDPAETTTVDLALIRRPADSSDGRVGSLVFNPGGPGGSAVELLPQMGDLGGLGARFDLIGMDPRGVGSSTPVVCDDDLDAMFALDPIPADEAERAAQDDVYERFAQSCAAGSGELLGHVGTTDVVADLESLREALGEDQLNFVGLSYGTYLGAAYADAHPDRVRAMVLDGAMDPAVEGVEIIATQAASLERSLQSFFDSCAATEGCALADGGDPAARFDELVDRLESDPLVVGEREVGPGLLLAAVGPTTIAGVNGYGALDAAISSALDGDGSTIVALADANTGRRPDGTYSGTIGSEAAVACLDPLFPTGDEQVREAERRIAEVAPRARGAIEFGWRACADWPVPPREPARSFTAEGAAPILVVGTTGDPSTPYAWAEALAADLESATLLTYDGEGHTALGRSACIDDAIVTYMVEVEVPPDDTVCASDPDA